MGGKEAHLIQPLQYNGHACQIPNRLIQPPRPLDKVPIHHLRARNRRHDRVVILLRRLHIHADLLDHIHHIPDPAFPEPELLFVESSVFDAAHQVVEPLPFDDPVQHDLVAFFAVAREEGGVVAFGHPEGVAEFEGAHAGRDAFFAELGGDVVAVVFGADFAVVEDELHGEGTGGDANGVEGGREGLWAWFSSGCMKGSDRPPGGWVG